MPPKTKYEHILGRLDELANRVSLLETAIAVLQSRIETFFLPKNPSNNEITFRWMVERVFMPLAITVLTAIIVSALLKGR